MCVYVGHSASPSLRWVDYLSISRKTPSSRDHVSVSSIGSCGIPDSSLACSSPILQYMYRSWHVLFIHLLPILEAREIPFTSQACHYSSMRCIRLMTFCLTCMHTRWQVCISSPSILLPLVFVCRTLSSIRRHGVVMANTCLSWICTYIFLSLYTCWALAHPCVKFCSPDSIFFVKHVNYGVLVSTFNGMHLNFMLGRVYFYQLYLCRFMSCPKAKSYHSWPHSMDNWGA